MKISTHFSIWLLICIAPWLTEVLKEQLGSKFLCLIVLLAGPANFYWLGHRSPAVYALALLPFFACLLYLQRKNITSRRFFWLTLASWMIVSFPQAILLIPSIFLEGWAGKLFK
jgi:hypothetical protein